MKKFLVPLLLCVSAIALMSCSATPLTQNQVDLQKAAYASQVTCFERLKIQDVQISAMLAKVPAEQVALVMVLQSVQENNKALMSIATGNDYNPCSTGDTAFDVQIAEIIHKNKAAMSATSDITGLGQWIVGAWAVTDIVDTAAAAGGTTINGDNNEINKNSKNTTVNAGGDAETSTTNTSENGDTDNSDNSDNSITEP